MSGKKDDKLKCSFCGKTQDQVTRLIAGPGVYICDQCVELCSEIMEDEMTQSRSTMILRSICLSQKRSRIFWMSM